MFVRNLIRSFNFITLCKTSSDYGQVGRLNNQQDRKRILENTKSTVPLF